MAKRLRMSIGRFNELQESLRWCQLRGFIGLTQYYQDELEYAAKCKRLPHSVQRTEENDDGRDQSR
jgi:hypothetical protein